MATERISRFVVDTTYDSLPPEAIRSAKQAIVDCLGCAVAGSAEDGGKILSGYVKEKACKPEAGIIGGGFRSSPPEAAWVNGMLAHVLDYDDVAIPTGGHPSVAILPTALALGEALHSSGKDVLLAYIMGFEAMCTIGRGVTGRHYILGWHCTATNGALGAAVVGAKLLKLDLAKTRMAIGIAASTTGGLKQNFGTMTKSLHAGNAARVGVVAASLAERGFTAVEDILETPQGFAKVFGGGEELDVAAAAQDIGRPYMIASTLEIKPYPSCRGTHPAIDAALGIRKGDQFNLDDVAEIEVHGSAWIQSAAQYTRPKSALEGKFSVEYCVARVLLENEVGMKHFTDEQVLEPKAQELVNKTTYIPDPEATGFAPCEVVVKLKDGRTLSHKVTSVSGDPTSPVSEETLFTKYRDCASAVLSAAAVDKSLDMAANLDKVDDIAELMGILCKTEAGK
ncbi:MAG: MmgE/PrpD family protein [Chloroflexota bacterium]|nr:MmgE/PrpD family protein [Chloroflexota bacterium]